MAGRTIRPFYWSLILLGIFLSSCAGKETFSPAARAGDTIALAAGWKHEFTKDKITVTITPPSPATPIVYGPNNSAIRAAINWYPDPVSWLTVGTQNGGYGGGYFGSGNGDWINAAFTGNDPDWWQTVLFIDLPTTLTPGTTAQVTVTSSGPANEVYSVPVQIVGNGGAPTTFKHNAYFGAALSNDQLNSMGRASHYVVSFDGDIVPYGIQLVLSHNGSGSPFVINTRGDIKSINWSDTGSQIKVLLTPANAAVLTDMKEFKFYVSGGVGGLQVVQDSVHAYDAEGAVVAGVTASIQ